VSDVQSSSGPQDKVDSGGPGTEEASREVPNQYSVHISAPPDGGRRLLISELTARTLLAILDTVVGKGSAAKFQLALAQQELERGIAELEAEPIGQPPTSNRATRRALARVR
jgi:hypothetical protein